MNVPLLTAPMIKLNGIQKIQLMSNNHCRKTKFHTSHWKCAKLATVFIHSRRSISKVQKIQVFGLIVILLILRVFCFALGSVFFSKFCFLWWNQHESTITKILENRFQNRPYFAQLYFPFTWFFFILLCQQLLDCVWLCVAYIAFWSNHKNYTDIKLKSTTKKKHLETSDFWLVFS